LLELGYFAGSMVGSTILLSNCSSPVASFDNQVCLNPGFDCMFGAIGLAFLSGLGGWDAVVLTLDVGFICHFVVIVPTD
jgi:hypothetical protein